MKILSQILLAAAILVVVGCVVLVTAVYFSMELDKFQRAQSAAPPAGRYQIVLRNPYVLRLDTSTGSTSLLLPGVTPSGQQTADAFLDGTPGYWKEIAK